MTRFIFGNPKEVLSFRSSICLRIANENLLETLDSLLKMVQIELSLSSAQHDLTNKIFR